MTRIQDVIEMVCRSRKSKKTGKNALFWGKLVEEYFAVKASQAAKWARIISSHCQEIQKKLCAILPKCGSGKIDKRLSHCHSLQMMCIFIQL